MACDPSTLMADAKCVAAAFTYHQSLAAWTYLACNTAPAEVDNIVTEEGDRLVTEDGDPIITE